MANLWVGFSRGLTHREQGSGKPVYVKRGKSQFKPRRSLSAGFRGLLSLQIIDCVQHPFNTQLLWKQAVGSCRLRSCLVLSVCSLPCRSRGHAKGGEQNEGGP